MRYADSTLLSWKKAELLEYIRTLQANNDGLQEMNDRQAKMLGTLTANMTADEMMELMKEET